MKIKFKWIYIILLLIAFIFIFITPEIISLLLFNRGDSIAFISYGKGFILYTLSFILATVVLLVLHNFKNSLVKIFITALALSLFFYVNFVGTLYSTYLDDNMIEFKPLFGESETYEWSKITKVFHELPTDEYDEKYILEFNDGQTFEFIVTKNLSTEVKNKIYEKMMSLHVSYEEY